MSEQTHIVQGVRVDPKMPLEDFLRLWLIDEDLGLRFERKQTDPDAVAELEFDLRREGEITIRIGVARTDRHGDGA